MLLWKGAVILGGGITLLEGALWWSCLLVRGSMSLWDGHDLLKVDCPLLDKIVLVIKVCLYWSPKPNTHPYPNLTLTNPNQTLN